MKRDMDLIREILLRLEAQPDATSDFAPELDWREEEMVAEHILMMAGAGLVTCQDISTKGEACVGLIKMTWQGHDFLDTIRDDAIWKKTKEGVKAAGGFSIDLLKALAKGLLKTRVEQMTGVKLDL